jgi:hypothetical protein
MTLLRTLLQAIASVATAMLAVLLLVVPRVVDLLVTRTCLRVGLATMLIVVSKVLISISLSLPSSAVKCKNAGAGVGHDVAWVLCGFCAAHCLKQDEQAISEYACSPRGSWLLFQSTKHSHASHPLLSTLCLNYLMSVYLSCQHNRCEKVSV